MENLLNRGLNFTILSPKLDITQTLVEFKQFERSAIWHEFWFGRQPEEQYEQPLFKTQKSNLPKNYTVPQGLKTFLGAIKSEIMDHRNRNNIPCNIPPEEIAALKDLIKLQRDRVITIKACDKGAGVIILDFNEYMRACYMHLSSQQLQPDGSLKQRFNLVDEFQIIKAKEALTKLLEEGLDNKFITNEEFSAMDPENKDLARFYCNFKVHKEYEHKKAPPPRPIISG